MQRYSSAGPALFASQEEPCRNLHSCIYIYTACAVYTVHTRGHGVHTGVHTPLGSACAPQYDPTHVGHGCTLGLRHSTLPCSTARGVGVRTEPAVLCGCWCSTSQDAGWQKWPHLMINLIPQ